MTRLFNLESYIKLCQYAYQFNQNPEPLISTQDSLPIKYQYGMISYRGEFVVEADRSQQLKINHNENSFFGEKLTKTGIQRLFIIRDTIDLLTLSTSQFLNYQESYLYKSAYYYWNYEQQLKHLNRDKPLVFVDLDGFECDRLIPVTVQPDQKGREIPILNTKKPLLLSGSFKSVETYNQICRDIAIEILHQFFSDSSLEEKAIAHLQKYLQKIAIFEQIPSDLSAESINLIVEILHSEQIYYKQVQLNLVTIEKIVNKRVNFLTLEQLANPDYHWVLISQYNRFPSLQQRLSQFLCVQPKNQSFATVWERKQKSNFSLFGIYLDTLEFEIGTRDKHGNPITQWIQLSDQTISYEGSPLTLRGTIPETNQNEFLIRKNLVKLPIKVNGEQFLKNGIPQNYQILIENFPETKLDTEDISIKIKIEFILKLNAPPELKVSDISETYKITSKLVDRVEKSFGYIPYQQILKNRQDNASQQFLQLQNSNNHSDLKQYLEEMGQILDQLPIPSQTISAKSKQYRSLKEIIKKLNKKLPKNRKNLYLFQCINASQISDKNINEFKILLESHHFDKLPQIILQAYPNQIDFMVSAIILIGRMCEFSENFSLYSILSRMMKQINQIQSQQSTNTIKGLGVVTEYFMALARTAIAESKQKKYFDLFSTNYSFDNNQYLWGYSRILSWYYDFTSKSTWLDYKQHFLLITQHLLNQENFDNQYKQNAFLSLCYLLTFRETNLDFFKEGSIEKQQAMQVIEHFKNDDTIKINLFSKPKLLNEFFAELIEGKASQSDLDEMIQAN